MRDMSAARASTLAGDPCAGPAGGVLAAMAPREDAAGARRCLVVSQRGGGTGRCPRVPPTTMVRWECVLGTVGLVVLVGLALYLAYLFLEIHVLPGRPVRRCD